MPEEAADGSQAEQANEPQAGQTSQRTEGQVPEARGVDVLPDWAQAIVRDARKQAAAERKKLQPLEQRLTEFENRDKSDSERLTAERDRLAKDLEERETRVRDLTARQAVYEAADNAATGKVDRVAVYKIVRDELEYDSDGAPTNVDAVIAAAKKDHPGLFPATPGKADAGSRDSQSGPEPQTPTERLQRGYATQSTTRNRRA